MSWFRRHKVHQMFPPEDRTFYCPKCEGAVEMMVFCTKHPEFGVLPCGHTLNPRQVSYMTGIKINE